MHGSALGSCISLLSFHWVSQLPIFYIDNSMRDAVRKYVSEVCGWTMEVYWGNPIVIASMGLRKLQTRFGRRPGGSPLDQVP